MKKEDIEETKMNKIHNIILEVQKELKEVTKNAKNPHFKSDYANFNAVLGEVKEKFNDRGVIIMQIPDADEFGKHVKTSLIHVESGEEKSCKVYLELPKADMQKMGSAISYAKRYGLQTLSLLPSADDDGNDAVGLNNEKKSTGTKTFPTSSTSRTFGKKLEKKETEKEVTKETNTVVPTPPKFEDNNGSEKPKFVPPTTEKKEKY